MHDLRRTSLSPIEPADKPAHRETIAHSIIPTDAGKIKDTDSGREECRGKERNGTNLRHLEHRWAIAISGLGTGRFDKRRPGQDYGLAKHARMNGETEAVAFLTARSLWIIFKLSKIQKILYMYLQIVQYWKLEIFFICKWYSIYYFFLYFLKLGFALNENAIIHWRRDSERTVIHYRSGVKSARGCTCLHPSSWNASI